MRILRLTNSNDALDDLPVELRASSVTDRLVAELTGEPVQTTMRAIWPGPELPGIVQTWLERYEPDVVFMRAASFWVTYESVPLRVQRRLGAPGRLASRVGFSIGSNPTIVSSRLGRAGRKLAVRALGGDTHFTPEDATGHVAAVLKVILARESSIPVVRGPGHTLNSSGGRNGYERALRLNKEFDQRLAALCARLHVPYASARDVADNPSLLGSDELHDNAEGQRVFGELEGRAIAEAWSAASVRH